MRSYSTATSWPEREARRRPRMDARTRASDAPRAPESSPESPGAPEALDARLVALARAGGPLRWALGRLAARLLAGGGRPRGGWETLGFVRAADYAREQLGISGAELGDLARVGAALGGLRCVEAALLSGRLSWTKVRLLAGVATEADETAWLAVAERTSAAALAQRVRQIDRGCLEVVGAAPGTSGNDVRLESDEAGAPEEACATLAVPCPARVSARWGAVRRLARRVAGEWLSAAACAEAVTAEAVSALLPLEVDPETLPPPARRDTAARSGAGVAAAGMAEPIPPEAPEGPGVAEASAAASRLIQALVEGIEEADLPELDARLRRVVALERTRLARLGPVLLELAEARGFRDLGFTGLDAYVRERLGMAPRSARALLRLERACRRSAPLRRAWRSGALAVSKAQALVAVVLAPGSAPWVAAWLARAGDVTVRRLEDDVDHALATGTLDPAALPELPVPPTDELGRVLPAGVQNGERTTGGVPEPATDALGRATAPPGVQNGERTTGGTGGAGSWRWRDCVRIHAPVEVVNLLRACLCTVQRRIERAAGRPSSRAEALEAILDHVLATWAAAGLGGRRAIPPEHRVFARDGWRCVVPGCTSHRNLQAHHVRFRSAGGSDALFNLATLCAAHHQRGVHGGHLRIHGTAPGRLRFEMPLGTWRSGDRRAPA